MNILNQRSIILEVSKHIRRSNVPGAVTDSEGEGIESI